MNLEYYEMKILGSVREVRKLIQRIGEALFQVGGIMFVAGFIMVKYPGAFSWFGKLPGDYMTKNVIAPITSMIVVSLALSFLSWFFGTLLRLIR